MIRRVTLPEIAEAYGRSERVIAWWRWRYDWPEPVRRRSRRDECDEYDAAEVDAAIRAILAIGGADADPGELLDARQAAAEAGVSYGTVRAYISKGQWPEPDEYRNGGRRWRRSTVRDEMASRKPDRRRRARKEGA